MLSFFYVMKLMSSEYLEVWESKVLKVPNCLHASCFKLSSELGNVSGVIGAD